MNEAMQILLTALLVHVLMGYQILWFKENRQLLPEWYRSFIAVTWVISLVVVAGFSLANIWGWWS